MGIPIHTSQNIYSDWNGAYIAYIVSDTTIYHCRATAGTSVSVKGWQIFKQVNTASTQRFTWPQDPNGNASTEFIFIADQYAGYVYV